MKINALWSSLVEDIKITKINPEILYTPPTPSLELKKEDTNISKPLPTSKDWKLNSLKEEIIWITFLIKEDEWGDLVTSDSEAKNCLESIQRQLGLDSELRNELNFIRGRKFPNTNLYEVTIATSLYSAIKLLWNAILPEMSPKMELTNDFLKELILAYYERSDINLKPYNLKGRKQIKTLFDSCDFNIAKELNLAHGK